MKRVNAWDLFNKYFKENDWVIIIDEYDKLYCGQMKAKVNGLFLTDTRGKLRFHKWDDIRFISHDGFPCKELLGADGSESIELEKSVDIEDLISLSAIRPEEPPLVCGQMTFGDPFLIENTSIELVETYYPGSKLWQPGPEDVLLMHSNDGATGMLYEFQHIYHYEGAAQ